MLGPVTSPTLSSTLSALCICPLQFLRRRVLNVGVNNGFIGQTNQGPPPGSWAPPSGHTHGVDLKTLLNPILDASHTRNLKVSPPNSKCYPRTRQIVIGMVLSWVRASMREDVPHIMWIYGYAGCGKSAISQAVAEELSREGRLAASFFFFRGSGDRSRATRFANTIAHQLAIATPTTARIIEEVARADPGVLSTSTSSLSNQFEQLVYKPVNAIDKSFHQSPVVVVIDGVDECEGREEVAAFIEDAISFFDKNPLIPLRFVIASRVEDHIHRELHASSQVHLLNLVEHTSDDDISTALDVAIEKEKRGRVLACAPTWPERRDKRRLVKHIGGSYIFMTTIVRLLFAPSTKDGLTPMERLPLLLEMEPDFDALYREIIEPCGHFPLFLEIVSTIALAAQPLSIAQIADLLEVKAFQVTNVLTNLHSILQVPGDDHAPVTLWHTSLRDFLRSRARAGPFFANPRHHIWIADRAICIAASSRSSYFQNYSQSFTVRHLAGFADALDHDEAPSSEEGNEIISILEKLHEDQTPLEVACRAKEWGLIRAVVNAGADVNMQFKSPHRQGMRVPLHVACHFGAKEMVYLLLEKGADPNVVGRPTLEKLTHSDSDHWGWYAFPLAWAIGQGDPDLVNRLLSCGADPNLKGGYLSSALHVCAWEGMVEIARILVAHSADPNIKDSEGRTPLHRASWKGHIEAAEHLLDINADPNIQDKYGDTPLHFACDYEAVQVAECLLDHNADPTLQNHCGETALQVAKWYGEDSTTAHEDSVTVRMLLGRGIRE